MAKAKGSANKSGNSGKSKDVNNYSHGQDHPLRPDIGTEPLFKKKKPPATYRYDSSLAPALDWDDQPARLKAEQLIQQILEADDLAQAQAAAQELKALGRPFLNWTGKAERLSFDVPTLPLFVHERLSTRAIVETLKGHQAKPNQLDLFSDPQWSITDQILRAYEYHDRWVNRMILGDSLVVMNSLMQYEGMAGQVQMIYMDPPYGVKFGSNFQPFVRKRDVKHNDDDDLTREPEMVQAYRDTWELGLHSYLTYLRDRLLLARELLADSGSVFVQISDENVHHVREIMDEVFGAENFLSLISFTTTSGLSSTNLSRTGDYLVWYSKEINSVKYNQLFTSKNIGDDVASEYKYLLLKDGTTRPMTKEEQFGTVSLPPESKAFRYGPLTSSGYSKEGSKPFKYNGQEYFCGANNHWKVTHDG
ncbi:MAG: DNA methyltransferase, partial [Pseudanabaenaceae cyanobacterium]